MLVASMITNSDKAIVGALRETSEIMTWARVPKGDYYIFWQCRGCKK
jgi:hypothetical protein